MTATAQSLRLGALTLDLARGLLLDPAGVPVALRPQAWRLLRTLALAPGRLHSKQELLDAVWPGLVVTEDSLVQAVGDIRQALGEHARERLRTLPRRGYMLVPDAPEPRSGATTSPAGTDAAAARSLGDRLREQAARRFTGRETELRALRPAVARDPPAEPLVFVHGPGGIGKSSLLERLRLMAEPEVEVVCVNGAELLPTPQGIIEAMGSALGLRDWEPALDSLAARWSVRGRGVLLLDTFEALDPVQGWMRDTFLPALPAQVSVVLAGRRAPDSRWSAHPLWASAMHPVALQMLQPGDCARLAQAHGAPPQLCAELAVRARGLPLAAVLLATEARQTGALPDNLGEALVQALTQRCLEQTPSGSHREALLACALARRATRELLAHLFGPPQADPLFEWLASQGYVTASRDGLRLHDLMREAVLEDTAWCDRDRFRQLRRSVLGFLAARVGPGRDAWDSAVDLFFARRRTPSFLRFYDIKALTKVSAGRVTALELPEMIEFAKRQLPEDEFAALRLWAGHAASHMVAARSDDGSLCGATLYLRTDLLGDEDIVRDPVVRRARDALGERWREGSGATYSVFARHWIAIGDTTSPNAGQTALCALAVPMFADPALRLYLAWVPLPAYMDPMWPELGYKTVPECSRTVGTETCNLMVRDWQADPWSAWIQRVAAARLPEPRKA